MPLELQPYGVIKYGCNYRLMCVVRVGVATLPMPSIPPPPPVDHYDYDDDYDGGRLPPTVPPRRPTVASARMCSASSATCDRAAAPPARRAAGTSAVPPSVDRGGCFDTTSFIVEQTGKCVAMAPRLSPTPSRLHALCRAVMTTV